MLTKGQIHVGARVEQQPHDLNMSLLRCHGERGGGVFAQHRVGVDAVVEGCACGIHVAFFCSPVFDVWLAVWLVLGLLLVLL